VEVACPEFVPELGEDGLGFDVVPEPEGDPAFEPVEAELGPADRGTGERAGGARKPVFWHSGPMKTTLDLPDEVVRAVKIRAVEENRKLEDIIADLLRRGLAQEPRMPPAVCRRVKLPLVECAHEARPGQEMTPEQVADVLLEEEAGWHRDALR
jgi:plasmid stability protein